MKRADANIYFTKIPASFSATKSPCDCIQQCETCCGQEKEKEKEGKMESKKKVQLSPEEIAQVNLIHRHVAMHAANDEQGIKKVEKEAERHGIELQRHSPE